MKTKIGAMISNADFDFENSNVKIIANRNCPEIKLAGVSVGPFEEGNEYEIRYWIARELQIFGISHFREDEFIETSKVNKIQWTERVQTAGQTSRLPDDFYPKLRRYLAKLKAETSKGSEKILEHERAKQLTRDVVNSRLRKIILMASAPAQTEQMLKNFTREERFLYEQLYRLVNEWRTAILEYGGAKE